MVDEGVGVGGNCKMLNTTTFVDRMNFLVVVVVFPLVL